MGLWHKITGYHAHRGAGRNDEYTFFAFVEDALEGFQMYKRMRGVKRDAIPLVRALTDEETSRFKADLRKRNILLRDAPGTIYKEYS